MTNHRSRSSWRRPRRPGGATDAAAARPLHYEIILQGVLGDALVRSFAPLEVCRSGPQETSIRGWFADQAALQDLIDQLAELNLQVSYVRALDGCA